MWPRADPENQEHKLCFILYLLLDTNTPPSPPGQNRQKARSTQLKLAYHTEPCSLVYKCSNSLFSYLCRYGKTPEIRSTRKGPLRYKFSGPPNVPPIRRPGKLYSRGKNRPAPEQENSPARGRNNPAERGKPTTEQAGNRPKSEQNQAWNQGRIMPGKALQDAHVRTSKRKPDDITSDRTARQSRD